MKAYESEYLRWIGEASLEEELRSELEEIRNDPKAVEERFYTDLEFGTAGLRGILGAGTNRMNAHVVRRASRGLADYILSLGGADDGVAIAFDSRRLSSAFALECARTLAGAGVKTFLFDSLRPVPELSFAVRHLGCAAGVVITASHNPPEYNGFKVYARTGGQADVETAAAIYERICEADYFAVPVMDEGEARAKGLIVSIGAGVDEAYYAATEILLLHREVLKTCGGNVKIVYSPLHGSGNVPVRALLERVGVSEVYVVAEQEKPDPAFPTVKAPNPEDPAAFTLGIALADKVGADVILATDPDSDRLGAAVRRDDGSFRVLTGNTIGSFLLHYILSSRAAAGTLPENGLVVKSLVSTRLADAICARYGVECMDVPTGFRFISEEIERAGTTGEHTFLFGFEESYGFLAGGFSRDKDAVCAAMLFCEACIYYASMGRSAADVLREMESVYGCYGEGVKSYTFAGKEGLERIAGAMAKLRAEPPREIAGVKVALYEDMLAGSRADMLSGAVVPSAISGINVLRYTFEDGTWMCVRPSGTEPKLKLYLGAVGRDGKELNERLCAATADADALISERLGAEG